MIIPEKVQDSIIKIAKLKLVEQRPETELADVESVNVDSNNTNYVVYFNFKKVNNKKISYPIPVSDRELLYSLIEQDVDKEISNNVTESATEPIGEIHDKNKNMVFLVGGYLTFLANKSKFEYYAPPSNIGKELASWIEDDADVKIIKSIANRQGNKRLVVCIDADAIDFDIASFIQENIVLEKGDIMILKLSVASTDTSLNSYIINNFSNAHTHPVSNDVFEEIKDNFINDETIYKFANDVVVILFK